MERLCKGNIHRLLVYEIEHLVGHYRLHNGHHCSQSESSIHPDHGIILATS